MEQIEQSFTANVNWKNHVYALCGLLLVFQK